MARIYQPLEIDRPIELEILKDALVEYMKHPEVFRSTLFDDAARLLNRIKVIEYTARL